MGETIERIEQYHPHCILYLTWPYLTSFDLWSDLVFFLFSYLLVFSTQTTPSLSLFLPSFSFPLPYCTVLYCTVLSCTVLYCTVLSCPVLYCTVLSRHILLPVSVSSLSSCLLLMIIIIPVVSFYLKLWFLFIS